MLSSTIVNPWISISIIPQCVKHLTIFSISFILWSNLQPINELQLQQAIPSTCYSRASSFRLETPPLSPISSLYSEISTFRLRLPTFPSPSSPCSKMTNQPKLRYHRAQWDLLEQHGSPAFFYEHSFGSPIETDVSHYLISTFMLITDTGSIMKSDWGSPKSVIEAPVAEQSPTTAAAEPHSVAEASSSTTADASEESSQSPSHLDELIRDYRRKVQENRSSCLETKIGHPSLSPATPSSYVAKAVRASPPNLPSIEQRLERASLNAKANSSTSSNQAERSRGRKIQSNKKVSRSKRDLTPTPKEPQGGSGLTPEIEALLEYQRSVYGVSTTSSPPLRAFGGILGHVCKMINAKAISALLSENVDENTTNWL